MDYKFTFEDGSEAYLAHYGVKGMTWKNHMAKPEDEEMKRRRVRRLRNIQKSLGEASGGATAKKAKAKVKAHFANKRKGRVGYSGPSSSIDSASAAAIRKGRKLRGTYSHVQLHPDGSVTSALDKDRKNW